MRVYPLMPWWARAAACRLLASTLALCALAACTPADVSRESYVFGTRVEITVAGAPEDQAIAAIEGALAELDRLHQELHSWQPSPVTRMNAAFAAGKAAPATPEIAELLRHSQWAWQASDGLFNPAIGGLITAWGFHADDYAPVVPSQAVLSPWLAAHPTPMEVQITGQQISSRNPAVRLDFGGIAKGWALDRLATRLKQAGIRHALINIGGNLLAIGQHGDRPWHVGLQDPRKQEAMLELDLQDGEAIGTSGDYQRFFMANGQRYSHLIDPRTGQPSRTSISATVLADGATPTPGLVSDAASKPLFIGGQPLARHTAERFHFDKWLVVAGDGAVYLSQDMARRVHWRNPPAHIHVIQP